MCLVRATPSASPCVTFLSLQCTHCTPCCAQLWPMPCAQQCYLIRVPLGWLQVQREFCDVMAGTDSTSLFFLHLLATSNLTTYRRIGAPFHLVLVSYLVRVRVRRPRVPVGIWYQVSRTSTTITWCTTQSYVSRWYPIHHQYISTKQYV